MTPIEALECVMTARSADWVDDAGVFHDRLRALGFTVVPIEPTEEQVEAMAGALCEVRGDDPYRGLNPDSAGYDGGPLWWTQREAARAAYAAAVKETADAQTD